ncbi:MAG: zinc-dependent metalloprotease [Bdellovibrio sp.]|nr:zinc-dependent metalloprotease [Bdellovibrio sp.]
MADNNQYVKALSALLATTLFVSGCTKTRDAALPDTEALSIFAISEFETPTSKGFQAAGKVNSQEKAQSQSNMAVAEKGLVAIDPADSSVPERLRFMFENLEVSGQQAEKFKIVFGVDAKFVTAYKQTNDLNSLTKLEKQLAVSPGEVQLAIDMQKASTAAARKALADKIAVAQKERSSSLVKNASVNVLVPLFKYEIQQKGILERTKNELRESTSTLTLRETEFSQATHIRISMTSDGRREIGSVDQKNDLEQLFTTDSLDNKTQTAGELQSRYSINMKFIADDAKVLTKLDSDDLKVYEVTSFEKLSDDEKRLFKTNHAAGEILRCEGGDKNCVLRLVAKVPVTYKNARLVLADSRANSSNTIEFRKVTKAQSQGLVEIAREVRAERARPTGMIDPLNTIKVADLSGEFYFRRTFEDGSNMLLVGKSGTSGDLSIVKFELEKDRVVVRNQKALIQYIGQGAKDREELMSVPVKYFKLEKVNAEGVALQVPKLIDAKKEDAEYIEIDWTRNTLPIVNSPLAYFSDIGRCITAQGSATVTAPDIRLANDGIMNFSIESSYGMSPDCANVVETNSAYVKAMYQLNFNVTERLSFKKKTNPNEDVQFAPNISPDAQGAMNFAIFTLADKVTDPTIRAGRENSEVYRPVIHDFRDGKVLKYWIGGLTNSPRRALIEEAAKEVIAEWNVAFHKALKGTSLERSGDYIVLQHEDDSNRGHLGDLDRNYLWFFDIPTENGLLGVAQPGPNPNSGTIVHNNVMVYTGNTESSVRGQMAYYNEAREYEKMLEEAKQAALLEFQKQQTEDTAPAASSSSDTPAAATPAAATAQIEKASKRAHSYLQKMVLSARPVTKQRMSSKYASAMMSLSNKGLASNKRAKGRSVINEFEIKTNKDFTRRVMQEALSGDFKNDPLMLEAIIAQELARTEPGMSAQTKELLNKRAQMQMMTAKFEKSARQRGACFKYARTEYNDAFVAQDFETSFKAELKATLLHEIGHAVGLIHNYKASFDKANFAFEGEETKRNYTSIMDYIAAAEMKYQGPGTYDVHALRAIYAGLVELSQKMQEVVKEQGGNEITGKQTVKIVNQKFIKLDDVKNVIGLQNWSNMPKLALAQVGLLRQYGQCNDGQVGIEPGCTPYDEGASATEVVKNEIQNYHRSYAVGYHAADRLNFGWSEKVRMIQGSIGKFSTIRSFLDSYFKMDIYGSALSAEEMQDFRQASQLGYDFFHEVLRIPDTQASVGSSREEIQQRLMAVPYVTRKPKLNSKGAQMVDAQGRALVEEVQNVRILEARRVYDKYTDVTTGRMDTLGIGFDKQFALQFLLTANPRAMTDDSQIGWISYNEFEKYYLGVSNPANSMNMLTLLEIMSGNLTAGFVDENHNLQTIGRPVTINRNLLDTSILGGIVDTNQYRMAGLDLFAEFFKVGTLKGGKTVKDRATVSRIGQASTSNAGVKFYAVDNSIGATVLVQEAARKGVLIENKDALAELILKMAGADMQLNSKIAALKQTNKELTKKTSAEIIATSEELQGLEKAGNEAAAELVKALTTLNANRILLTDEELKANPNLNWDKQVPMVRGMLLQAIALYSAAMPLIQQHPLDNLQPLFTKLDEIKTSNDQLASVDFFALAQEVMVESVEPNRIKLESGRVIPGSALMGMILSPSRLTTTHSDLMYSIEDLARYTRIINPEYFE